MSWLAVFSALIKLTAAVADILRNRRLIEAGEAIAVRKSLEEANARVEKAHAARRAAAAGGMRDDDPYLRD